MSDAQTHTLLAAAAKAHRTALDALAAMSRRRAADQSCEDLLWALLADLDDALHAAGHLRFR